MNTLKKYSRFLAYLLPIAAFILVGSMIPNFLKISNLLNIMRQCSVIAICAVGMTSVIVIKGIDLSVGGTISLCAMVSGLLMLNGVNMVIAMTAAAVLGCLIGIFSGLMVVKLEVPSFITTLVVGQVAQGITFVLNNGKSIGGFNKSYVFIGNGAFLGIPISNYIMLIFVLAGAFVTTKLPIGTHIYGLGGNEAVEKQEGINTGFVKIFVFAIAGLCSAIAGILLSAQLDTVYPIQGEPYQLDTIAACVIGGVSMMGGEGKVTMSLVGALIIGSARNALNLLGVHPFYQNIFVGAIIIIVVAVNIYSKNRKESMTQYQFGAPVE